TLPSRETPCLQLTFSADGQYLASRSDGTVRVWKLSGEPRIFEPRGHSGDIYDVCFDPSSRFLATAGADRTARVWDINRESEVLVFRGHTQALRALAFQPNGKRLASASQDGTVKLWDALRDPRGLHLQVGEGRGEFCPDISFSANGRW